MTRGQVLKYYFLLTPAFAVPYPNELDVPRSYRLFLAWRFSVVPRPGRAPFTVRGYSVSGDSISFDRLFWSTRLPVTGLQSVRFEPDAVPGSIRTFVNGGFFSFPEYYRNKRLGSCRAFVTEPRRVAGLRFPKRAVVLSAGSPQDSVHVLSPFAINARWGQAPIRQAP